MASNRFIPLFFIECAVGESPEPQAPTNRSVTEPLPTLLLKFVDAPFAKQRNLKGQGLNQVFPHTGSINPRFIAIVTAWVLSLAPNFDKMLLTCDLIVRSVTCNSSAMILFDVPRATSRRTAISRSLN